ncbi:MAG: energy transducer TonB, partial [Bacteroidota bacterium]
DGTALVRFIISKEGDVEEIVVLRGLCDDIKEECYRVVSNMPRWTPGYQKGEPVRVQFNLPIKFRLK